MTATGARRGLRRWLDRPLVQNALALYGLNASSYVFPVVTAPYLARVLHPEGWGRVALAQSLGQSLAVVVEYGFTLSATRAVARAAASHRGELLVSVVGAKLVLAVVAIAAAAAAMPWLAGLGIDRRLLWSAVLWAVANGFHPLWYYQGRERVRPILLVDLAGNALAVAGVLAFCRAPADGWKVLAVQATTAAATAVVGYALLRDELQSWTVSWDAVRERLSAGSRLFLYRIALTLYTVGNPLLLGIFASPTAVGYFAAGEKIVKTLFVAAIHPLNQALYPYVSRVTHDRGAHATRVVGNAIAGFAIAGAAACLIVLATASPLVRLVFGADYAAAVLPLRILAVLLPVLSISTAIVMHRLLIASRDRVLLAITVAAGVVNVALAMLLGGRFGAPGMAASVVVTELLVLACVHRATARSAA